MRPAAVTTRALGVGARCPFVRAGVGAVCTQSISNWYLGPKILDLIERDVERAHAVIVDVVRTPSGRGKPGGALSGVHPVDLAAGTLTAILERNGLESRQIDDVLMGCVSQVGDQAANIARQAVLAAGFDESATYPVMLNVHGGPHSQYGETFFDEAQLQAADAAALARLQQVVADHLERMASGEALTIRLIQPFALVKQQQATAL